jgi:hypothetical protein
VTELLDRVIADARRRLVVAETLERKLKWAKVLVAAKKRRGDYDQVVQPPLSPDLEAALARHEAQAAIQNLEGERHD